MIPRFRFKDDDPGAPPALTASTGIIGPESLAYAF